MNRQTLSAVLITRNAANHLAECLASVTFCDEIVVVDSASEDATIEIARRYGARVVEAEWRGFGPMKQFAVEQAAHDWVLCIDADERVSERLKQGILAGLSAPKLRLSLRPAQSLHGALSETRRGLSRLEFAPLRPSRRAPV